MLTFARRHRRRDVRFVVVEVWRDKAALDAHGQSAATFKFRDKFKPIADAPYDERINTALYVSQGKNESQSGAIYVVTHVDVIPAGKDDCMAALKAMSVDTASDAGNISYEASSRRGPTARRSTPMPWRRIRSPFAQRSARSRARSTTSAFTRR